MSVVSILLAIAAVGMSLIPAMSWFGLIPGTLGIVAAVGGLLQARMTRRGAGMGAAGLLLSVAACVWIPVFVLVVGRGSPSLHVGKPSAMLASLRSLVWGGGQTSGNSKNRSPETHSPKGEGLGWSSGERRDEGSVQPRSTTPMIPSRGPRAGKFFVRPWCGCADSGVPLFVPFTTGCFFPARPCSDVVAQPDARW